MKKAARMRHGRRRGETCVAVSTSYGGMTRVRFGGSFPRGGKSRLLDREAPLSYGGKMASHRRDAKWKYPTGLAQWL